MQIKGVIKSKSDNKIPIIVVKSKISIRKTVSSITQSGYHSNQNEVEQNIKTIYKKITPCIFIDSDSQKAYTLQLDNADIKGIEERLNLNKISPYKGITLPDELYGIKNSLNIDNAFVVSISNESTVKIIGEVTENSIEVSYMELVE